MKPSKPKSPRDPDPSQDLRAVKQTPPPGDDESPTGGSEQPTQQRTLGDEIIRLDEADAPTAVPDPGNPDGFPKAAGANRFDDDSLISIGKPPQTITESPATWLGARGYRIDRLLGRGGYGEVYLADHPKLPRQVAIKVPRADVILTAEFKRRFLDEANIVSQLDHPNVVTIYDMIAEPYPAIIYEYCGDGTLQTFTKAGGDPIDEATAVKLFAIVADALAFAHNRGVLHRDIKPSNILMQAASHRSDSHCFEFEGRWWTPKLADFGLAKVYGEGNTETASGMVAGTPEYMSPEQAIGRSRDVGTFSDTFSLGVLIYRTLIGCVPFHADSRVTAILKIENGDYVIPRRARPELSVDVEAVIVKSLRPSPLDRYRDASELLGDLNRLLHGQPVEARPYTWRDRVAQTVRRYPVATVSTLFTLAGLLLVTAMIWRTSLRQKTVIAEMGAINRELAAAMIRSEMSEQAEVRQRQLSEKLRYASEMRLCQESFRKGDIKGYQELLDNHIPVDGQPDHRGFSWYWLWEQGHAKPYTIDQFAGAAYSVAFSPDEMWLSACGADGFVKIYSVRDWSLQTTIQTEQGEVNSAHFSSDGNLVVTAGDDGTAKIWQWQTNTLVSSEKVHAGIAYSAQFIAKDTKLVTCGNDPTIRVWDLANENDLIGELLGHTNSVDSIRISRDEKFLVSAGADGTRIVWDLDAQDALASKPSFRKQRATDVAIIHQDNATRFLSASLPGNSGENALLLLENFESEQQRVLLTSTSGIQSICASTTGNQIAVGDRDGGVTLLDISDILNDTLSPETVPNIVGRWNAHRDRVYCAAFSPSGKHLVTCGKDGNVFRWEPGTNQSTQFVVLEDVPEASADEGWTATAYADRAQQVFAVSSSLGIDCWDVKAGQITRVCNLESPGKIQTMLVNPEGNLILVADLYGKVQRLDLNPASRRFVATWQRTAIIDEPPTTCCLAVSKDSAIVASAHCRNRNVLTLLDVATGEVIAQHSPKEWLSTDSFGIALSPNTNDRHSGRVAYAFGGHIVVVDWVADKGSGNSVRWINERLLDSESDTVLNLIFVDHDTILATTTRNQLLRWNLNSSGERQLFSGQPKPLKNLRLSPDGREVWTASSRNTFMAWCMHTTQNLVDMPITEIGSLGEVKSIGCEVTGMIGGRKLFWQPLLSRWPDELSAR